MFVTFLPRWLLINKKMESNTTTQRPDYSEFRAPHHRDNNIETLAILHLVKAILTYLFSFFFVFYIFMGSMFSDIATHDTHNQPPFDFSVIFGIIGVVGIVCCVLFGTLNLLSYSYLKKRKNYTFVFVVSIINCLSGILGILLGVFTLVEINKPHVKDLFERRK